MTPENKEFIYPYSVTENSQIILTELIAKFQHERNVIQNASTKFIHAPEEVAMFDKCNNLILIRIMRLENIRSIITTELLLSDFTAFTTEL